MTKTTTIRPAHAVSMTGAKYVYVTARTARRYGIASARELPTVAGYRPFSDPTVTMREHGGSVYIAFEAR
jgi:hypothetical protein